GASATVTLTLQSDQAGSYADSFSASANEQDGTPNDNSLFITGTVINPPAPVANPDTFSTSFKTMLTVPAPGVLVNDTGTGLTALVVTGTTHGTLTLSRDGLFYMPDANFSGTDSFTYQDRDVAGQLSNIVTDTITVNPPAPAANTDTFSTDFNTTLTVKAAGELVSDTGRTPTSMVAATTA